MTRAPRAWSGTTHRSRIVGTGLRYTDLETLRLEWFIRETRLTVGEIAARLGRSRAGLYQHLYRSGVCITEERNGEGPEAWSGV